MTNRNSFGEEEVRWSLTGALFRHEIFLKKHARSRSPCRAPGL